MLVYIPLDEREDGNADIFREGANTIPVRILHHEGLFKVGDEQQGRLVQDICIHFHGGGFVCGSSNGSQIYTRQWANIAKVPVFSVDYGMAPAHPFPEPVHDCLRAYQFITENIHRYFNIRPKNVYLGGDSAGGTLSCAVTALILKRGLTAPKGLHLVNPSLDPRTIIFGSKKFRFSDPLLWPSLVKLVHKVYFVNETALENPLASPLLLTEGYLSGKEGDNFPSSWPTTYIEVGTHDSLRD
jgi:acetyl esterase/lipase